MKQVIVKRVLIFMLCSFCSRKYKKLNAQKNNTIVSLVIAWSRKDERETEIELELEIELETEIKLEVPP